MESEDPLLEENSRASPHATATIDDIDDIDIDYLRQQSYDPGSDTYAPLPSFLTESLEDTPERKRLKAENFSYRNILYSTTLWSIIFLFVILMIAIGLGKNNTHKDGITCLCPIGFDGENCEIQIPIEDTDNVCLLNNATKHNLPPPPPSSSLSPSISQNLSVTSSESAQDNATRCQNGGICQASSASHALFTDDVVVFGILVFILGTIYHTHTHNHPWWKKFYAIIPPLLLIFFIPGLFGTCGVWDASLTKIPYVADRFLLPAAIVLLTMVVPLQDIISLGPKTLLLFLSGTSGVIFSAPLVILIFKAIDPSIVSGDTWKGLACIAGSFIGSNPNMLAIKETFDVSPNLFSIAVAVDTVVAFAWLAILLSLASKSQVIDKKLHANTETLETLLINSQKLTRTDTIKPPTINDYMNMLVIAFTTTGIAQFLGTNLAKVSPSYLNDYFWLIVMATAGAVCLSFSSRIRDLETRGASKVASLLISIVLASNGMQMDLLAIKDNPSLFAFGFVWLFFHVLFLAIVTKLLKAPFFFFAVGSIANVGGTVSAPIVAAAFHPSLAPVGVLLAVLGNILGTYGALLCAFLMQLAVNA